MLCAAVLAGGCVSQPNASLVGSYYAPQLCSNGSDFDLTLSAGGSYRLIRTLPEGVGPDLGEGVRAGFEEVGRWSSVGSSVTLVSEDGKRTTKLQLSVKDGVPVLCDGQMFGLRFEKQRANQRPDGTSAKAPPSKPSQGAAVPHP